MLIWSPVLRKLREENLEFEKGLDGTARLFLKTTKTLVGVREIGGKPQGITESRGPGTLSISISKPPILRAIYLSSYKNNPKTCSTLLLGHQPTSFLQEQPGLKKISQNLEGQGELQPRQDFGRRSVKREKSCSRSWTL